MSINVAALILSAGFSSRMGDFKPLLPLGEMTALERTISLFRSSGVEDVRVVTGFRSEELEPLLTRLGVRTIVNTRYSDGMFTSVIAGAETIGNGVDAFFILPVDIPLVRPATIRCLLEAYDHGNADVLYPCFQEQRGHPPLISARHAGAIVNWCGGNGLRGALAQWETGSQELEVADEHIHNDMDTPEAHARLVEKVKRHEIPTEAECMALLNRVSAGSGIIGHGRAVADLAVLFARKLNLAGYGLDIDLLTAAGLLHDLARAETNHAQAGARLLREAGFGAVADLVASHMDLEPNNEAEISPKELLYLADKLVRGERRVTLAERFQSALERHGHDPAIFKKVSDRLNAAHIIKTRLEATLGRSMEEVINIP
jgi:molybdenum cofactor cytidylyltransferase